MQEKNFKKEESKTIWFKTGIKDWGWVPVSWQGWVAVAIFSLLVIADFIYISRAHSTVSVRYMKFIPRFLFLTLIMVAVCFSHGEKPEKWSLDKSNPLRRFYLKIRKYFQVA